MQSTLTEQFSVHRLLTGNNLNTKLLRTTSVSWAGRCRLTLTVHIQEVSLSLFLQSPGVVILSVNCLPDCIILFGDNKVAALSPTSKE